MSEAISIDDIQAARARLAGVSYVTPLLESQFLNRLAGRRVLIKPECLQKTGSFKIRGAFNKIACLSETERQAGVVAYSSGNHAQGVAAAAHAMGVSARIVMPKDAPNIKLRKTAQVLPRGLFRALWIS